MTFDVVVYGGGIGGCIAAVSAARAGARVALLEPLNALGGTSTLAWVTPWQSFHHSKCSEDTQLYHGIAQELVDHLYSNRGCLGHLPDPIGFSPSLTPYEPEILLKILPEWVENNDVQVQLNYKGKIIQARAYIDASFDLDLVRKMGFQIASFQVLQPASLLFRIGGVNEDIVKQQILENPKNFYRHQDDSIASGSYLAFSGFYSEVLKAQSDGKLDHFRDRILAFGTTCYGELIVNTSRVPLNNYLDQSEAVKVAQDQILQLLFFMRTYLPGFEKCELIKIAPMLGVRETVHIIGESTLTTEEVKSGIVHTDDIALGAFPIDIHRTDAGLTLHPIGGKGYYGIPKGCVIPKGSSHLYVASKCISVESGAFASTRVSPTVMSIADEVGKLAVREL